MATAPTQDPVKLETKFGVACCKLLAKYPLYQYREKDGEDHYRLRVLLIGSSTGDHMKDLMNEILANGQLLKTALQVTVLSETAEEDERRLHKDAPHLYRFIRIEGVSEKKPGEFEPEWEQGCLTFVQGSPADAAHLADQYCYVFISTGDNGQNQALAQTLAPAEGGLLAYNDQDAIHVLQPDDITLSGKDEGEGRDEFMEEIHAIAHNLHFVYMKELDVRETRAEIHYNYFEKEDRYNHLSDLEAALHVRSKLACCDITEPDLKKAAAAFAKKISDGALVEQLAELEHRRWCISKMLQGFYCPDDVSGIYRDGNATHSKKEKWHTILVPYSGGGLDLDEQTRRIQARCAELTEENRAAVTQILDELQLLVMRKADVLRDSLESFTTLRWAVEQLWAGKRSIVPTYKRHKRGLEKVADAHKKDIPDLKKLLGELSLPVDAQIECVSVKDYKKINRILVRQIPFALTHKVESVLVKPLADRDLDCLFSPWRLEPTAVLYVDLAESQEELRAAANRAERLNRFLKNNNNGIARRYYILHPKHVKLKKSEVKKQFEGSSVHLKPFCSNQDVAAVLTEILDTAKPDYVDLTGGNPVLTVAARQYAADHGTGAFYVRGGRLRDISNAVELEYEGPEMDITVQEMFDKAGAELIKTDSRKMSDGAGYYQTFWDIALKHRDKWDAFCRKVALAYRKTKENKYSLTKYKKGNVETIRVTLADAVVKPLIPILLRLCEKNYLDSCDVSRNNDGTSLVAYRIRSQAEGRKLRDVLLELAANHQDWIAYDLWFTEKNEDPRLSSRSLRVEDMDIPAENKDAFEDFLNALEEKALILELTYDSTHAHCSFRAASTDVRDILLNSGKVLEAYIYYSAMLDGRFDDVDMSVFFHHSGKKGAAKNEVDVICTRGISSLFISAKNVRNDHIDSTFLNHVCYEVSVLADQFGINAKRVLVAPDVKHIVGEKEKDKVAHALARNVYLVGRELCRGNKLGEVLKKIAAGEESWDQI